MALVIFLTLGFFGLAIVAVFSTGLSRKDWFQTIGVFLTAYALATLAVHLYRTL